MNAYFHDRSARRHWTQRHTRCQFLFDSNSTTDQPVNTSEGAGSTALQKSNNANLVASGAIGVGTNAKYQEAGAVGGNQSLSNIGNSSVSAGGNLTVTSNAGVDASLAALQTALTNAQDQINSQSNALQTALTNVTPTPGAIPSTSTTTATGDSIFTKLKNWLAKQRGIRTGKFYHHLKESEWRWNHRRDNLCRLLLKETR
jgi:hypothetical protein